MIDAGLVHYLTPELIAEAEQVRTEMKDLPSYLLRRKIRDMLDAARRRLGTIARHELQDLVEDIL